MRHATLVMEAPETIQPRGAHGSRRLYRFVYWHKVAKVWVWHRKGHTSHGQHTNQIKAAQMAAAAYNMPVSQLRLRPTKQQRPQRLYRHVHYHTGSKTWVVQQAGQFVGSSTDQHYAARLASRAFKQHPSKLRLQKATKARPALLSHRLRFQLMWAIYSGKVPGDLADLFQSSHTKDVMNKCPELLLAMVVAKYGPHREALAASAAELAGQRAGTEPVTWLHAVLQRAIQMLSGTVLSDVWVLNVGRGTTHHSGLVTFAVCSLRMLRSCSKQAKGALCLGRSGQRYKVVNTKAVERRLASLAKFGHAMAKAKAPRTTGQWTAEMQKLQAAARGIVGLRGPTAYRTMWVIRSWLVYLMRQAKVSRLQLDAAESVSSFAKLFPDNRAWVAKLAGRGKLQKPMAQIFADLGCPSPT